MEGLLAEQKRNAQPGPLHGVALDLVDVSGSQTPGLHGAHAQTSEHLLQLLRLHRHGIAAGVPTHKAVGAVLVRLGDELRNRHPGDQIIEPLLHGKFGVLIRQHTLSSLLIF